MWEAFWPLKGMKMQPTKKRTIAKCIITAIACAHPLISAIPAAAYTIGPQTLFGPQVATRITGKVTTTLMIPVVEWTAYENETSTREISYGVLKIHADGAGAAPSAYLVGPCNGAPDFTVTVNDEEAGPHITVSLVDGLAIQGGPEKLIDANETGRHDAVMNVNLTQAPMAGEYRTCVGVMAMADDGIVAG